MGRRGKLLLAKILIFVSFLLIAGGNVYNELDSNIIDPINDVISLSDDGDISVTTLTPDEEDKTGVTVKDDDNKKPSTVKDNTNNNNGTVKGNNSTVTKPASGNNTNTGSNSSSNNKPNTNSNNNTGGNSVNNNTTVQPSQQPTVSPIEQSNLDIRNSIQNRYGIIVKYGAETNGYSVGGFSTTAISNPYTAQTALNNLDYCLSLYPNGFFQEIRNGGIPLTVYLIQNYSDKYVTGVTDSSYSRAIISIAVDFSFGESFNHEVFHYIEKYMKKLNGGYEPFISTNWNMLNPGGFSYGTISDSYSFTKTGLENSFFVNNYAQHSPEEDRASTFEFMMSSYETPCFKTDMPIWRKASYMSDTIDLFFNSVIPTNTEYWERWVNN